MTNNKLISVIIPVYHGELLVNILAERLINSLEKITGDYEIILINDASPDNSWNIISQLASENKKITAIDLQQNYGQHAAIKAGLEYSAGEWIVVMDCDLQDQPEEIIKLYHSIAKNSDSVFALRSEGRTGLLQRAYSRFFYFLLGAFTGIKFKGRVANFGIYHKALIKRALSIPAKYFFLPLAVRRAAEFSEHVEVEHAERHSGKTTYSFFKAMQLAIVILAANSFLSFLIKQGNDNYVIREIINPNK
ncbi:MAG: glycosyltransferase family 2 protein [Chitinophagales bacterium]